MVDSACTPDSPAGALPSALQEPASGTPASSEGATPQARIYRLLCATAAFLSLVLVIPSNAFQNLSPWINLPVGLFGTATLALYAGARRSLYFPNALTLALVAVLNATWFVNGGAHGSVSLYFPAAFLLVVMFYHGALRWIVTALLTLDLLGLFWIDQQFPQWITPFATERDLFWDLATGAPIATSACVLIGSVMLDAYHREHARLLEANDRLTGSLAEIRTLRGLLPICSWCRKVRDDDGLWQQVDKYLAERTDAEFTHGICPECEHTHFPEPTTSKRPTDHSGRSER